MNRDTGKHAKENITSKREQEIMEAAVKVFSKKGFSGATTREIAAEAGVAEGTIFRYFKTKKDILFSLAGPFIVESLANVMDEVKGETDEVVLKAILKNRLNLVKNNIDLIRLIFTEAQFHHEIREQFIENVAMKAAGMLERFISERIWEGEYKEIKPQIASRALVGMAIIFVMWKDFLMGNKYIQFNDEEVIDNIIDIFLYGIKKNRMKGEL
ncbi:MAG: hypothetical protein CVV03_03320 [Firmicutes bacterium HGW-Firmicutes-8]|nr:MAG: hypothetical protein CVV03_03320 [Firmicutes bacterium HGW-Firmicutes-8]